MIQGIEKSHSYELVNNYYTSKIAFGKLLKYLMYTKNAIWNDSLYTKLWDLAEKISPPSSSPREGRKKRIKNKTEYNNMD